jgi:acyl carrier protein
MKNYCLEIKKELSDLLGIELEDINDNSTPDDCIEWDSIANVRILLKLENIFSINIDHQSYYKCKKVSELCDLVSSIIK